MKLGSPELMARRHQVGDFDCGDAKLNDWLRDRALVSQLGRRRCTYVVSDDEGLVRGYYTLSAGGVSFAENGAKSRRNMPDPVPVMVLDRLAIDQDAMDQNLAASLLKDAVARVDALAQHAGVRVMLANALDDSARRFYERHGFRPSASIPEVLTLQVPTSVQSA